MKYKVILTWSLYRIFVKVAHIELEGVWVLSILDLAIERVQFDLMCYKDYYDKKHREGGMRDTVSKKKSTY